MSARSVTIRTPDQRLRVFVSSTMQELAAERNAAVEAIRSLKLTPVLFELGARPHPPRDLYRAYLQQSHVFVGVYGEQYGWVAPGMTISGLEDEYQLAAEHPKLIYVRHPAPHRDERLKDLLARIEAQERASYKCFASAGELGALLANDLAVLLSERFESGGSGVRAGGTAAGTAVHPGGWLRRRWPVAAAAAALILASGVGAWFAREAIGPGNGGAVSAAARGRGAITEATSIAVLPFVNMSADPEQEYFSDGLSEELLNVLARHPELRVISRTSSFQFKGKAEDVREIARKLAVAHVLEGSVRKSGRRVRITVQLVNAADGAHQWSQTYDRDLDDIFRVQEEIAGGVADVLRVLLAGAQLPRRAAPRSMEAYHRVLEARYYVDRRAQGDLAHAVELLEQALRLDPGFATAWAELARAQVTRGRSGLAPIGESVAAARRAAQRALALDPDQATAYSVLGWIRANHDWDWAGADQSFQRALALDPGNARILASAGNLAVALGRLEQAIALYRQSIARDPLQDAGHINLAVALYFAGRLTEAEAAARHGIELGPDAPLSRHLLAKILLLQGKTDAALEENAREPDDGWRLAGEALILHAAGRRAQAAAALAALIARFSGDMPFQIAEVHAYRGEPGEAFRWLERAREQRDSGLGEMKHDPLLRTLVADPRYRRLLSQLRLPV